MILTMILIYFLISKAMYKVITPAGTLIVQTIEEAKEYKRMYGYPYVKIETQTEES